MTIQTKKLYIVGSIVLLIMIGFTIVSTLMLTNKPTKINAADTKYTISVSKVSTVSVYVTGEDVIEKEDASTESMLIYEVKANSSVILTCVNESRLFQNWVVKNESGNTISESNDKRLTLTVNENLIVSTNREDPTVNDLGKYMDNPFSLSSESNLLYLENIFDAEEGINNVNDYQIVIAYTHFFQTDPTFKTKVVDSELTGENWTERQKVEFIKNNGYFERIQNGYYKVQESFTVLNEAFNGVGSLAYPFKGVICGLNNATRGNSQVFLSLNLRENTDDKDLYCGLFEVLDENAVVRNLIVNTSIGIAKTSNSRKASIYAGAVAGKLSNSLLVNLKVSGTINIETNSKNVYAGGIAGIMTGGIDEISNLDIDFSNNTWALTSGDRTETFGGLIAGKGEDVYIKEAVINVSDFSINAKNVATGSRAYNPNTQIGIGNLFGYYTNSSPKSIENIEIKGTKNEYMHAIISNGNSYVGGLIGYILTTSNLSLGNVAFNIQDKVNKTKIISESLNKYSQANLYSAGLVAYVEGTTFIADENFKKGITTEIIDDKEVDVYHYLFSTNMEITSKQEGIQPNDITSYGNCIAAGIVAHGFFDISGTDEVRSNILVTSGEYSIHVNAIQTSMSTHSETTTVGETNTIVSNYVSKKIFNNYRHCLASLVFGFIEEGTGDANQYTYKNINVYANNSNVEAIREIGSRSIGDVNASGFLCDSNKRNFKNITMYLGEKTYIKANSLSYEVGAQINSGIQNNVNCAYASAFIGNSSTSRGTTSNISNIKVSGYNFIEKKETGTSVEILGIQNAKAIDGTTGCGDYTNESYVGGVFGALRGSFNIQDISVIGNPKDECQIIMQGHRDPNTAFVGGIVGFVKLINNNDGATGTNQTFDNCCLKNTKVYGSATINKDASYNNPDIYVGGIVGASFADDKNGSIIVNNSKVIDSTITGFGNERIEVYVGGVLGTQTWSGNATISDCYVLRSKLSSSIESTTSIGEDTKGYLGARVGGIAGTYWSSNLNISYSAVIDCELNAFCSSNIKVGLAKTAAGIIFANTNSENRNKITNCYTNSVVSAMYGTLEADAFIYDNTNKSYSALRSHNYYVSGLNSQSIESNSKNYGTALSLGNVEFTSVGESSAKSILELLSAEYGSNKQYIYIFANENFGSNWTSGSINEVKVWANKSNVTSEAQIWINAKENGDTNAPTEYKTETELINAGWFKLGLKYLICGNETGDVVFEENSFKRTYLVDDVEYRFDTIVDGKYRFVTLNEPYKYLYDLGYVEYEQDQVDYKRNGKVDVLDRFKTDIFLKSISPSIKILFSTISAYPEEGVMPPTYYASWLEQTADNVTDIDSGVFDTVLGENSIIGFGSYTYTYTIDEYIGTDKDGNEGKKLLRINYELIFTPNKEIKEDAVLYVGFYVGSGVNNEDKTYAKQCLRFDLKANKYKLKGGTLAEYTPAMNDNGDITNLGQSSDNPYHFQVNTAYRIIPVLYRINEPEKEIISELNIQDVLYSLYDSTSGSIRANGELTTSLMPSPIDTSTGNLQVYRIKLQLKDYDDEKDICFIIVSKFSVAYSADGGNLDGLPFSTNATDYYLDIDILAHCGGIPTSFSVKINGNTYTLLESKGTNDNEYLIGDGEGNYKWIYDENGNQLTYWNNNLRYYQLRIPKEYISDNISVDITFPINFTIEFHIQTDTFNPKFGKNNDTILSVKVKAGTKFQDLFSNKITLTDNAAYMNKTYKEVLDEWTKKANNDSFGYLFTGFYLIDNSTSITSYGQSFEKIFEANITINTSYVFYARWSFLIELIEAPGTHIVTSFSQNFLYEVDAKYHQDLLKKNITIPINNNRGYVFTIVKDSNFIGEADVEAYIISETKENIKQITIEKYHDNMYLYFIPPEEITGYLVIATRVSNSDIIVGEDIASVTKEVLPEDGIYTFKYTVNHMKNKSYIYNGRDDVNYLVKNRELLIEFFEQTYDKTAKKTDVASRCLVDNTIIEVYYHKYINSSKEPSETILGKYHVRGTTTDKVELTSFTYLNGEGQPFAPITYAELLGDYDTVSEVYYFVIIPPNGDNNGYIYDDDKGLYGEYINNCLYVGYYDTDTNKYIEGVRTREDFNNIPIEDSLKEQLQFESACQVRVYTATPSRVTKLEKNTTDSSLFHFTDDKRFNVFDVIVENGELTLKNRIKFVDKSTNKNTVVVSREIPQGIYQLHLNFGYNKGIIKVSGSTDGVNYEEVQIFNVEKETFQDYIVEFDINKEYKYFKIEKLSDAELRLTKIGLVVLKNGMLYELEFYDTEFENIYIPNYTTQDINLPTMKGLTWNVSSSPAAKIVDDVLVVTRQKVNQTVVLTAQLIENEKITTKNFEVTVVGTDQEFTVNDIYLPNYIVSDFKLPIISGITWLGYRLEHTESDYSTAYGTEGDYELEHHYFKVTLGDKPNTIYAELTDGTTTKEIGIIIPAKDTNISLENLVMPTTLKHSTTLPSVNGIKWEIIDNGESVAKLEVTTLIDGNNKIDVLRINRGVNDQTIKVRATKGTETVEYTIFVPRVVQQLEISEIHLPNKSSSTLQLPSKDGLIWKVVSGNAIIVNNVLTLTSLSNSVTIKAIHNGLERSFTIFMQDNTILYTLRKTIVGDVRHDNKRFIMAVQFKDAAGNIVENIDKVSVSVNGYNYFPIVNRIEYRNVVYFDLTEILERNGGVSIDVKINVPETYVIHSVQLLECSLHLKPAMGEIRNNYTIE